MYFNLYRESTRIGLQVLDLTGEVIATYRSPVKDLETTEYLHGRTRSEFNGEVGSFEDLASRCNHLPINENNLFNGLMSPISAFESIRVKRFLELVA